MFAETILSLEETLPCYQPVGTCLPFPGELGGVPPVPYHVACVWLQGCKLEVETHEMFSFFSDLCGDLKIHASFIRLTMISSLF